MFDDVVSTDHARVLAELLDTALADDWNDEQPAMVLLWQASDDPDDLRIAVKRLEQSVDDELALLDEAWSYLAVGHSAVTRTPPSGLLRSEGDPVRITVAVDHESQSGVVRHANGATQWFGAAVDIPIANVIRSRLWLEPAA
ncbi:MAG: hypothetical protein AB1679_22745 [Actinomycetota bacterium]|jgi:hypothetical protein